MTTTALPAINRFAGEYAFLSNFAPSPVRLRDDGGGVIVCATVEHAFQAAKTLDPGQRRFVAEAPSPGEAKRRGRRVVLRPDWDEVRLDVMRACLAAKFRRGSDLAARLVATGSACLVEGNSWGDRYWGVCDGAGLNCLGKLLMERRAYLAALVDYPDVPL
jgi:ribA/ribD-fused uncharacterized protein